MTPLEFLRAVWPDRGFYCIATPFASGVGFDHKVFDTIDAAAAYCDKVSGTKNVYFATHVLKAERIWNTQARRDKQTGEWKAGWSVRTQKNMRACRILFFDLDVGIPESGKLPKYETQIEAAAALMNFVTETGLPRPMVISSGNGIHVHWVLDRELDSHTEWLTLAQRLKQLASHYKLRFDPSRTTDSASVLRVSGTFNHKGGVTKPVEAKTPPITTSVEDFMELLGTALDSVGIAPKADVKATAAAVEGLGDNTKKTFDGAAPPMKAVIKVCPQMKRLVEAAGLSSEPEWYWGDIGVVLYSAEGREGCHKISSYGGHRGYSRAACDAKIDQWLAKASGTTSCAVLSEKCGNDLCSTCTHVTENSYPIVIARNYDIAPPPKILELVDNVMVERTIPNPPMPYKRDRTLGVSVLMENKEGKQYTLPIYPYDLFPVERAAAKETEQHHWRAHLPHGVIKDFVVEASTFVDDRALMGRLANNGVYTSKFTELRNYMSAYIQELQRQHPTSTQHDHLGWTEDLKFVMPDKVYGIGTSDPVSLTKAAATMKDIVRQKGTLQEQVRLLHFFDDPVYVAHQFFILGGLGSPVLPFTNHNGVVLNATGETGASKSTALYTAASFWGPPKEYTINGLDEGATTLSRAAQRDLLCNLPTCIDEITLIASDVARSFAMNATQTGPRKTLDRDSTPKTRSKHERSSITMTTSNRSLHDAISVQNAAGQAAAIRVFEILFKKTYFHTIPQANEYIRGILANYGHIGPVVLPVVIANYEKVKKRVIETMNRLGATTSQTQEERFWFAVAAVNLVMGEIAVKRNLISWDIPAIERWFIQSQIDEMRGTIKAEAQTSSAVTTLTNYLEHINGNIIMTTKALSGPSNLQFPQQAPRGEMLAHYEIDAKFIYVLKDGFRAWCQRRGQYSQAILKELVLKGVVPALDTKRTLGLGTNYAKGRSACFTVDMSHSEIAELKLVPVNPLPAQGQPASTTGVKPNLTVVK